MEGKGVKKRGIIRVGSRFGILRNNSSNISGSGSIDGGADKIPSRAPMIFKASTSKPKEVVPRAHVARKQASLPMVAKTTLKPNLGEGPSSSKSVKYGKEGMPRENPSDAQFLGAQSAIDPNGGLNMKEIGAQTIVETSMQTMHVEERVEGLSCRVCPRFAPYTRNQPGHRIQ